MPIEVEAMLKEAARLEGAGAWRRYSHGTLQQNLSTHLVT